MKNKDYSLKRTSNCAHWEWEAWTSAEGFLLVCCHSGWEVLYNLLKVKIIKRFNHISNTEWVCSSSAGHLMISHSRWEIKMRNDFNPESRSENAAWRLMHVKHVEVFLSDTLRQLLLLYFPSAELQR